MIVKQIDRSRSKEAAMRDYLKVYPNLSPTEMAKLFEVDVNYVRKFMAGEKRSSNVLRGFLLIVIILACIVGFCAVMHYALNGAAHFLTPNH